MGVRRNIFKAVVTSFIGIVIMFLSIFLLVTKGIKVWPDFVVMNILGVILLFAPKSVETFMFELIKAWGRKASGWMGWREDNNSPTDKEGVDSGG